MNTEKQLIQDKPSQTLEDLINLCKDNNIEKPILLSIIALYNRLSLDMQERGDVLKADTPTSVILVKRCSHQTYPITMI